jgi:hypothetical protein
MATKSKEGRRSVREVAPRRAQRYRLAAGWKAHPHFSWVLVRLPAMRCQKLGRYRGDCCILWLAGRPKWKSLIVRVARYTRALTVSLAHRRTTQVRRCSCRYHDAPCCSLDSFPRSIDFYSWNQRSCCIAYRQVACHYAVRVRAGARSKRGIRHNYAGE